MRVLLFFSLLLLLGCSPKDGPPAAAASDDARPPEEMTSSSNLVDNIQLVDLDNQGIDLKNYQGKTIFLNFWATWCKPCIMEMPSIERAQTALENENFIFLLASDENIDRIKRFQSTQDFNLTFVKVQTPFPELGVFSLPTTLVIDPKGKVTLNQVGALEWDAPEILGKLRASNL